MQPIYIRHGDEYVEMGMINSDALTPPLPPLIDLGLVVNAGDNLQDAINASAPGGLISLVSDGIRPPFIIPDGLHGLTIQAHPDSTHRQLFTSLQPFDPAAWVREDERIYTALYTGFPGRHWHWSRNASLQIWHKQSAQPDQFVYQWVDRYEELMPVFDLGHLEPGKFYVAGATDRPERVWIMLPEHADDLARIHYAAAPAIVSTDDDGVAEAVTLRGLDFAFAGSTHKRGAIHMGARWVLEDCSVAHSVAAGVLFDGDSPTLRHVHLSQNGQCSFYGEQSHNITIEDSRTSSNGTRRPNVQHEAGGKLVRCLGATIRRFQSVDDPRPIWLDINSHLPTVEDIDILRPIAAGVQFEHGCNNLVSRRVRIRDVQGYTLPEDGRVRRFGLVIQSRVFDGLLEDYEIDGADIGFLHKKHERRGGSGRITATRFAYENCAQNRYTETMSRQAIEAAIQAGAHPGDIDRWFDPDIFDATV